jgi:hypothetical protein
MRFFVLGVLTLISILFVARLVATGLRGLVLKKQRRSGYSRSSLQFHQKSVAEVAALALLIAGIVELGIVPVFGRYYTPFNSVHYVCLVFLGVACCGAIANRPVTMRGTNRPQLIDWHHRFGILAVISGILATIFGLLRAYYPIYRGG